MTTYVFNGNNTLPSARGLIANTSNDGMLNLIETGGFLTNTGAFTACDFYSPNSGQNNRARITIPAASDGGSVFYISGFQRQIGSRVRCGTTELGYRSMPIGAASDTICTAIQVRRQLFGFIGNVDLSLTPWDLSVNGPLTYEFWVDGTGCHILFNGTQYDYNHSGGNDASGDPIITGGAAGVLFYNNGTAGGALTSFDDGASSQVILPRASFEGGMQNLSGGVE